MKAIIQIVSAIKNGNWLWYRWNVYNAGESHLKGKAERESWQLLLLSPWGRPKRHDIHVVCMLHAIISVLEGKQRGHIDQSRAWCKITGSWGAEILCVIIAKYCGQTGHSWEKREWERSCLKLIYKPTFWEGKAGIFSLSICDQAAWLNSNNYSLESCHASTVAWNEAGREATFSVPWIRHQAWWERNLLCRVSISAWKRRIR